MLEAPPARAKSFAPSAIVPGFRQPFQVERVADPEALARLTADWEALDRRLTPRTPFSSPLWNTLWWKSHRSNRVTVRDELFLHVVRDAEGALVAVAPMMATERPSFGPVRVRTLQFFGTDQNVTELRGLVCAPEDQEPAFQALRRHLASQDLAWDWIDWGMVREESWSETAGDLPPQDLASAHEVAGYHLTLPPTWELFRSSRSRNIKESIRKGYNSLKRAGYLPELRVVRTPEECGAALEVFFQLHVERSRATHTVPHSDVFARKEARAFLAEYVLAMARRDQLRIFQLRICGVVVATRLAFLLGDELYLYYSGYDLRWASFSVMTTLVTEAIRWSIDHRLRVVNLSTGTDVSKMRWSPVATRFRSVVQIAPRWRARLTLGAYRRVRALGDTKLGRLLALARR